MSALGPPKTFRGADCFYAGPSPDAHKVHSKIHQSKSRDAPLPPRASTGGGGRLVSGRGDAGNGQQQQHSVTNAMSQK